MKLMKKFFGNRINEKGQEVPDPTPVELPLGYRHPEPLNIRMMRMIREELSNYSGSQGNETWEEANDFKVDDSDGDDGGYQDEDDEVAPNDPNVERAFYEKKAEMQKRVKEGIAKSDKNSEKSDSKTGEGK